MIIKISNVAITMQVLLGLQLAACTLSSGAASAPSSDDLHTAIPDASMMDFEYLDFNGVGFITKNEVEALIEEDFVALGEDQTAMITSVILALDLDQDGKISKEEFDSSRSKIKKLNGSGTSAASVSSEGTVSALSTESKKKKRKKFKRKTIKKVQEALVLSESRYCSRGDSKDPIVPYYDEVNQCTTNAGLCWIGSWLPGCTFPCTDPTKRCNADRQYGPITPLYTTMTGFSDQRFACMADPFEYYCADTDREIVNDSYSAGQGTRVHDDLCRTKCNYTTPFFCQTLLFFGRHYCAKDESACDEKIVEEWSLFVDVLTNIFPASIAKGGVKQAAKAGSKTALKVQLKNYAKQVARKKLRELQKNIRKDLKDYVKATLGEVEDEAKSEADRLIRAAFEANEIEAMKETERENIQNEFGNDVADIIRENLEEMALDMLDPFNIREFAEAFDEVPCEQVYAAFKGFPIEYSNEDADDDDDDIDDDAI